MDSDAQSDMKSHMENDVYVSVETEKLFGRPLEGNLTIVLGGTTGEFDVNKSGALTLLAGLQGTDLEEFRKFHQHRRIGQPSDESMYSDLSFRDYRFELLLKKAIPEIVLPTGLFNCSASGRVSGILITVDDSFNRFYSDCTPPSYGGHLIIDVCPPHLARSAYHSAAVELKDRIVSYLESKRPELKAAFIRQVNNKEEAKVDRMLLERMWDSLRHKLGFRNSSTEVQPSAKRISKGA